MMALDQSQYGIHIGLEQPGVSIGVYSWDTIGRGEIQIENPFLSLSLYDLETCRFFRVNKL